MAGIYPDWLGTFGTGSSEIVYIEVPVGGGSVLKKILVTASLKLKKKKKKIKLKARLINIK